MLKITIYLVGIFSALNCLAEELVIPVKHLSDQNLTANYTKTMVMELSGHIIPAGLNPIKSKIVNKLGPGKHVTVEGHKFLKVPIKVVATVKGESSSLESYTLFNPATYQPIKSFQDDGEVTFYRETKKHPEFLRVGEQAMLSKSETFSSLNSKNPLYKTTTLLSLVRVKGESDLFEFCETDYEYKAEFGYQKSDSEISSCLLINQTGEIRGYAVLVSEPSIRSSYVGSLRIE